VTVEDEVAELIEKLRDAGARRASANRQRWDGMQQLATAYGDIRTYAAEAERIGITRKQIAEAVGVSRQQLYNILVGATNL
jgi:CRP-like cAMP-binding protein